MKRNFGYQYSYPKSDSLEYRITESVRLYFEKFQKIPEIVMIPSSEWNEEENEAKHHEYPYFTFEGQFNTKGTTFRFRVAIEHSKHLPKNNVWCIHESQQRIEYNA